MSRAPRRWLQPELWLVLAIPLASLLGGAATLRLVQGDLSTDGAAEGVQRTAQVQTANLDPDLAAAQRHLAASLRLDRADGLLHVRLSDPSAAAAGLRVELLHALHADRDLRAPLERRGNEWVAALAPDALSRWRIVLSDKPRQWRLVGQLPRGGESVQLRPAVRAP